MGIYAEERLAELAQQVAEVEERDHPDVDGRQVAASQVFEAAKQAFDKHGTPFDARGDSERLAVAVGGIPRVEVTFSNTEFRVRNLADDDGRTKALNIKYDPVKREFPKGADALVDRICDLIQEQLR